jgi:hypothetical protein
MKSGNLNFLEPSGPLQACNGTALPLQKQAINALFYVVILVLYPCNAFVYMKMIEKK